MVLKRNLTSPDCYYGSLKDNKHKPTERCVLQNNAVDIYENYFHEMIPTELVLPLGVRTVNVYADPQNLVRPITHLSWSPDHGKRLAVSYCCMEFQKDLPELSSCSYIWDIDNPNRAFMALQTFCPSVVIEFNPRDPSMLISGLMSGQVCNWDIRTGNTPIQISHLQFSHRNPANQVLWINSKTNSEFFSASTGGLMMWWDIRKLREPTETLVMDLENPLHADVVKAIGVSAIQFEATMGTKFIAGMENGIAISGTRKGKNALEKLALRFNCHYGPVVAIDRNPFSTKNFLTAGDWTARIWAEDTKESNLLSTPYYKDLLTGCCWSTSRYSVFYTINMGGQLEVWDILVRIDQPVDVIRLCDDGLKAIAPHEEGKLVAVGSFNGNVYLVESSEALTMNGKNDKTMLTTYLDRCSRYEKAIDNRLKEVRLAQRVIYEEVTEPMPTRIKSKMKDRGGRVKGDKGKERGERKKGNVDKGKDIGEEETQRMKYKDNAYQKKDKDQEKGDEKEKKKGKGKKGKDSQSIPDDPGLAEAGIQYYNTIQKEIDKYMSIKDPDHDTPTLSLTSEVSAKRKKHEDQKGDKESGKASKDKSSSLIATKRKADIVKDMQEEQLRTIVIADQTNIPEGVVQEESEEKVAVTAAKVKRKPGRAMSRTPRTPKNSLRKPCREVCKVEVCCMDKKGNHIGKIPQKEEYERETLEKVVDDPQNEGHITQSLLRLAGITSSTTESLVESSKQDKKQILKQKDMRPDVLSKEVSVAQRVLKEEFKHMKGIKVTSAKARVSVKRKTIRMEIEPEVLPKEQAAEEAEETAKEIKTIMEKPLGNYKLDTVAQKHSPRKPKQTIVIHSQSPTQSCSPQKAMISVMAVIGQAAVTKLPRIPKLQEQSTSHGPEHRGEYPRM